jgi:ubiquinone/menaquinone biosynthesis C-methylase UbiE
MEINLLQSLPKSKRNITKRFSAKDPSIIAVAKQFGEMYWDGPREYGYGGYVYDGRWRSVARDIIKHYNLSPGQKVLDIGCGKGFLVKDLLLECPGLEVFGLDISDYALRNSPPELAGRLHYGSADRLIFSDNTFDCVLSINTLHNLPKNRCIKALQEIQRVNKGYSFVVVDSYYTQQQRDLFMEWVLTAEFHDYPEGWISIFKEASYQGDWAWTIID